MTKKNKIAAVIPAAGEGRRMGHFKNKLFCEVLGRTVIAWTIEMLENCKLIDEIILVANEKDIFEFNNIIKEEGFTKVKKIVRGSDTRQGSVYLGLLETEGFDKVIIHDGARPLLDDELIEKAVLESNLTGAAVVAVKVIDTIKISDENSFIKGTLNRDELWQIQTPQIFDRDIIIKAHETAKGTATDDAMLVEQLGIKVKIVEGNYENIKITTPIDITIAEAILDERG